MKFYRKFFSMLLTTIISVYTATAQTAPLAIGVQMPDITFTKTINFETPNVKISDFKGKLLILDFWATWCSPCVAEIPKMKMLQSSFKDSVVFLPVTYQDRTVVYPFADRVFKNKGIKIHSIISDTILNKMFPHPSIPFFVWIDATGEIIQTTDASQITLPKIREALNGRATAKLRPLKNYRAIDFKAQVYPTTIAYLGKSTEDEKILEPLNPDDVLFQSVLTRYNPNLAGKIYYDSTHFVCINAPVINFYRDYYGSWVYKKFPFIFWSAARCKVEISDSVLYNKITSSKKGLDYVEWSKTNAYCYELDWRNCKTWDEKFAFLKSDLDRYFADRLGIEALIEKRMVACDVLIKIPHFKSLQEGTEAPREEHDAFSYRQKNQPISALINRLQGYYWQTSDRPVFDETGLTGRYDLDLECDMNNINQVNAQLQKYGLQFILADRLADVLIIRKKTEKKKDPN